MSNLAQAQPTVKNNLIELPVEPQPVPEPTTNRWELSLEREQGVSNPKPRFVMVAEQAYEETTKLIMERCQRPVAVIVYWSLFFKSYGTKERKNYCEMSLRDIMVSTGLSRASVKRALDDLRHGGFIRRDIRGKQHQEDSHIVGRWIQGAQHEHSNDHREHSGVHAEHAPDLKTDSQTNRSPYSPPKRGTCKIKPKSDRQKSRERRKRAADVWWPPG